MRSPTTGKPFAVRTSGGPRWTGAVELIPSKLDEPLRWRKPQRIFVNSMSDLFHESLPDEAIDHVFKIMAQAPQHTFQILTKRPARMLAYGRRVATAHGGYRAAGGFDWAAAGAVSAVSFTSMGQTYHAWPLPNVWLGVSVEDQATADERIPLLLQTPAAVRFVSYEPALGPVDFRPWLSPAFSCETPKHPASCGCGRLDWLIVGGESGHGARPFDVAWARSAVAQCKAAGVPVFVKQLGRRPLDHSLTAREVVEIDGEEITLPPFLRLHSSKGGDMEEWPADLRVREFPA